MKTIDKLIALLVSVAMFLAFLLVTGCQDEVDEVITPPPEEAITSNSNVADLISRTTLRDGSQDNILDSSSCTSIVLPITVIANGLEIIIDSQEDFVVLERIFEELEDDDDLLKFIFPINVILSDHTEITINNEEDLENALEGCIEGGDDDDIECIDFNYPITVNTFDANSQIAEVITLNSDQELHEFLEGLDDDDVVSINFPITVVLSNGDEVVIDDNDELEDVIEDAKDDCDEDDDNDFDEDDIDDSELVSILTDGEWIISLFSEEQDETSNFDGYLFKFFENGSAIAELDNMTFEGEWETSGDDGILELELGFGDDFPLEDLDEDWRIIEFDMDIMRLGDSDDNGDTTNLLTFIRPMDNGVNDSTLLFKTITEGQWFVALYVNDGVDESDEYESYNWTFSSQGVVNVNNGLDSVAGNWSETNNNGEGRLLLDFEMLSLFEELENDWAIVGVTKDRIELREFVGGGTVTRTLVLRAANQGGTGFLAQIIVEDQWFVKVYRDGSNDNTADFEGFSINFSNDSTVVAIKGNDSISGIWLETIVNDQAKLILDFDAVPFEEFDESWEIFQIRGDAITLRERSEGGTDILILEKVQ